MIKSLLGEDEELEKKEDGTPQKSVDKDESNQNADESSFNPLIEAVETVDQIKKAIIDTDTSQTEPEKSPETKNSVKPIEVERPIGQPSSEDKVEVHHHQEQKRIDESEVGSTRALELEKKLREIESELEREKELEAERKIIVKESSTKEDPGIQKVELLDEAETVVSPNQQGGFAAWDDDKKTDDDQIQVKPKEYTPISGGESARNMGMAMSLGIALFGAVVIMLVIGWFADILLGTSPWGKVAGIILGAMIGILQLFRMSSKIVNPKPNDFERVSLASNIDSVEETSLGDEQPVELSGENSSEKSVDLTEETVEAPIDQNLSKSPEITDVEEDIPIQ